MRNHSMPCRLDAPALRGVLLCVRPLLLQFQPGWDVRRIPSPPWTDAPLRRIAAAARALPADDRPSEQLAARLRRLLPRTSMHVLVGRSGAVRRRPLPDQAARGRSASSSRRCSSSSRCRPPPLWRCTVSSSSASCG